MGNRSGKQRMLGILNGMKQRCYNVKHNNYKRYGGRGIKVCDEWLNDSQAFIDWALNNGYADDLTIDRIDNDGNYEPSNCRWITVKEQQNNKSTNIKVTYDGRTMTLKEWADKLCICYQTLFFRIKHRWSVEDALTTPADTAPRIRYDEIVCEDGENRELKVKEYQRRKAGMLPLEERIEIEHKKVMEKQEKIRLALMDNPSLSVRQLAKITGIPRSTVQRLKKGIS